MGIPCVGLVGGVVGYQISNFMGLTLHGHAFVHRSTVGELLRRHVQLRRARRATWASASIAQAFWVREDTVRLWRSDFMRGGVGALKATVAPGPAPVKSAAALRVATPLLMEPVADRPNWTIPRLRAEIEAREGVSISRSQLSKALRKKSSTGGAPGTR